MALTRASSAVTLYHLRHAINEHQELTNYLNSLPTDEKRQAAIRLFRNQIMQVHERVEDLVYDFVEFLENNSLYSRMTLEEEGWKVISAEHERIERERRDIAGARKTVASRWGQKLLDIWTPEQGSSLYSVKMNAMSKMRAATGRIQNEYLARAMMKQVIYHRAVQASISRGRISRSPFPQPSNYEKLVAEQEEVMLTEEQLNRMN